MRNRGIAAVALLVAALGLVGLGSGTASAAGACTVPPQLETAQYATQGLTSDYGTQAQILTRDATLCTGTGSAYSEAWQQVGLTADDSSEFVYTGYVKELGYSGLKYFVRYYFGSGAPQEVLYAGAGPAYGSTHLYTVQYNASGDFEVAGFDFQAIASLGVPFGSGAWAYRLHEYGANSIYPQTDIFGTSANQVTTTQLKVQQPFHTCCDAVTQHLIPQVTLSKFSLSGIALDAFSSHD